MEQVNVDGVMDEGMYMSVQELRHALLVGVIRNVKLATVQANVPAVEVQDTVKEK